MAKHNSGRKSKDGQNKTKKKREAERGLRVHKNKYEKHSRAATAQTEHDRRYPLIKRCPRCQRDVEVDQWEDHSCNR